MRTISLLLAIALGATLEPSSSGAQECSMGAGDGEAVRRVAEAIIAADNAGDVERVLSIYAPNAVLHPPGEPPVLGRASIRPRYEGLFADYEPAIESEISDVSICGTLAVVTGRNGGVLRGLGGRADRELSDAFVMVLARTEEGWHITRLIWHPDRSRW